MMAFDYQVHRTQDSDLNPEFIDFGEGFSSFDFVEKRFDGESSIHRCFSLARATKKCRTVIIEQIKPIGLLADENKELSQKGYFSAERVFRVSFWKDEYADATGFRANNDATLLGYFISKKDGITEAAAKWRVFEAVFRKI